MAVNILDNHKSPEIIATPKTENEFELLQQQMQLQQIEATAQIRRQSIDARDKFPLAVDYVPIPSKKKKNR